MNTPIRLSVFALVLVAVFGAAYGVGQMTGPVPVTESGHDSDGHDSDGHDSAEHGDGAQGSGTDLPAGLLVSDRGYTLTPVPSPADQFAFRITGPDGHPVTAFDVAHDKRMHLIVARRDLSGFRHVHPEMDADGTWRVAAPWGEPGSWRAFADFAPTGAQPLTLGVDVPVPGPFVPHELPAPSTTTTVDGYTVTLDGALQPGRTATVTLTVSRDGVPVTDLEPYLGAYGHLVVLRDGDLAYLHVHPDGAAGDGKTKPGPQITFYAQVPSAGTYRLFLDFQHARTVHTAAFTATAGEHGHD